MMHRFGDIDVSFKRLPPIYGYRSEKLVSVEKALEPIESQINELQYYIKIAKKHCHFPSERGLTRDQSAAVYIYTMEWGETTLYRVLNIALRSENRQALKIWFAYLKLFDSALDKLPTVKEILWRGVPLDIGKNFTKNELMTWWSINSSSSSVDVIKDFLEYENEDEIILRMGTQFRVKSNALEQSNGSHIVHLVEIDDDNDELLASTMNEMHVTTKPSNEGASEQPILFNHINIKTKWKRHGITIAGGNGWSNQLNQVFCPQSIYVDHDHQTNYIADYRNHRIVEWKYGAKNAQVVAGGRKCGDRSDQLLYPIDVIVDKKNDSLVICDGGNRRVVRWSRQNGKNGETIIPDINCRSLRMDKNENLYVSDCKKNEVKRWKQGETEGTIVAGGNGQGNRLNQLDYPTYIFIDEDHSIYVSDHGNHRVMKWAKGAKEGIVVAGGKGHGNSLTQLSNPEGVIVDHLGNVYVADTFNHRIMRWCGGSKEGSIVVGGNGCGDELNQFNRPTGLSFDVQGNLYVVDCFNNRIQKFDIDLN
ncbi:unnamed protein product [Adineta steineri]|uniref:Uncharacterized protein n=1 Tax=Adineta steineri TaxID=433720 RepID=A0A815JV54_9BILA|nr:unnamed protein product [Adineta steineri]CAF1387236.1 unnamed protein product [Adineta steineri]